MKGFIITEKEKNNIRKMYGIINEQTPLTSVNSSAGATVDPLVNFYYADDDWTTHEILTTIQIASAVLGMFPTPLSPLFWGISTIAGVADGIKYFKEDDPYMGTIVIALSLIPGNTLSIIFKSSKAFQILGINGLKNLIKAYKLGNLSKSIGSLLFILTVPDVDKVPLVSIAVLFSCVPWAVPIALVTYVVSCCAPTGTEIP